MPRSKFFAQAFLLVAWIYSPQASAQANAAFPKEGAPNAAQATSSPRVVIRKVYILPGNDDVRFALVDQLDRVVGDVLEKNSRFQLIANPKIAQAIRVSEQGYDRVIVNPEVHAKAARLAGADTSIVTEAKHVGREITLRQDWRRSDGSLLFTETQKLEATSSIEDQRALVQRLTNSIIDRIPYKGSVTGRTGSTVTLDLNDRQVSVGDTVLLGRITSTKEHPLLKTLVNVDYVATGRAEIISTDGVLSFARITAEENGEEVAPDHKVMRLTPMGAENRQRIQPTERRADPYNRLDQMKERVADPDDESQKLTGEFDRKKARYGLVSANLIYGSIGHDETVSGTATEISGSGFGGALRGEAWITKNWLAAFGYDFISAGLEGTRGGALITAKGASWSRFDFYAGYRYLPDDSLESTYVTFGLGYQAFSMNLPLDTTNQLGRKGYNGILLYVSGDLSINEKNRLEVGLGIQPFSSLSETEYTSGVADGASVVNAGLRWKYRWLDNLWPTLAIDYNVASGSFTTGKTVSSKRFSIGPGLTYTF